MLKPLLLFFVLSSATYSNAQVREITGLVTGENERLSGAFIKDADSGIKIFSDERGSFFVKAKPGDTLIASKLYYTSDTLIVKEQQFILFRLRKDPLMLKEVEVNSTPVTPATTYAANKKEYKEIYVNGDKSHIIVPAMILGTSIGIGIDITKLNNALGKKGHDARRLQRNFSTDYKNSIIDKRFNPLAARETGYKDKQLSDFIMYNRPSYDAIMKASDYDIIQYIKKRLTAGTGKITH